MQNTTEGNYNAEGLLSEENGGYSRDNIIVVSGAGVVPSGRIVGKITASGKYKSWDSTQSDGSQTAVGVLLNAVDATSADQKAVLISGRVQWLDAYISTVVGGQLAAGKTALAALGFKLRANQAG